MAADARIPLQILLVDDIANIQRDIEKSLINNGFAPVIDHIEPTGRELPLSGCKMPSGLDLEKYDLALIDLELFFPSNTNCADVMDMQGGTQILPYLREHAPWLPAIAQSILLLREARRESLHLTSCFGFDGMVGRDFFTNDKTNKRAWDDLRAGAELRRIRSVVGENYQPNVEPRVHIANVPESEVAGNAWLRGVSRAVGTAFHGSPSVTLDQLTPGFSGAEIFRALVVDSEQPNHASYWIAKTSQHPSKLHAEAAAHAKMMRAGHEFGISVPLLWHDVVVRDHVGVLAYKFADGTVPASRLIAENITDGLERVLAVVQHFHGSSAEWMTDQASPHEVIGKFSPAPAKMHTAVALLPRRCQQFYGRLIDSDIGFLGTTLRYRAARLHGDLHLDNILLGERSVLIDFARSTTGPLAVDLARLHADIYRVGDRSATSSVTLWADDAGPLRLAQRAPYDHGLGWEDQILFDLLSWMNIVAFLAYDDTTDEFRDWLLKAVPKFTKKLEVSLETAPGSALK